MQRPRIPVWQRRLGTPDFNKKPGMKPQGLLDTPMRPPRTPYDRTQSRPQGMGGEGLQTKQAIMTLISSAQQELQKQRHQILKNMKRENPNFDPSQLPRVGELPGNFLKGALMQSDRPNNQGNQTEVGNFKGKSGPMDRNQRGPPEKADMRGGRGPQFDGPGKHPGGPGPLVSGQPPRNGPFRGMQDSGEMNRPGGPGNMRQRFPESDGPRNMQGPLGGGPGPRGQVGGIRPGDSQGMDSGLRGPKGGFNFKMSGSGSGGQMYRGQMKGSGSDGQMYGGGRTGNGPDGQMYGGGRTGSGTDGQMYGGRLTGSESGGQMYGGQMTGSGSGGQMYGGQMTGSGSGGQMYGGQMMGSGPKGPGGAGGGPADGSMRNGMRGSFGGPDGQRGSMGFAGRSEEYSSGQRGSMNFAGQMGNNMNSSWTGRSEGQFDGMGSRQSYNVSGGSMYQSTSAQMTSSYDSHNYSSSNYDGFNQSTWGQSRDTQPSQGYGMNTGTGYGQDQYPAQSSYMDSYNQIPISSQNYNYY